MEKRMELLPGVTLTAVQTEKFKTGCFSINFFRPRMIFRLFCCTRPENCAILNGTMSIRSKL